MAAVSTTIAVAGLALGAVGTVTQIQQGRKQAAAQERAQEQQREAARQRRIREAESARRNQLQRIRSGRARIGTLQAAGAAGGVLSSSAVQGGVAGTQSVVAGDVGFSVFAGGINQQIAQNLDQAAIFQSEANRAASTAATAGALANVGFDVARSSDTIASTISGAVPTQSPAPVSAAVGVTPSFS